MGSTGSGRIASGQVAADPNRAPGSAESTAPKGRGFEGGTAGGRTGDPGPARGRAHIPVVGGTEGLRTIGRSVKGLRHHGAAPADEGSHHIAHHQGHENRAAARRSVGSLLAFPDSEVGLTIRLGGIFRRHGGVLAARFSIVLLALLGGHAGIVDALLQTLEYRRIHLWFFTGGKRDDANSHQHDDGI